MKSVTIKVVGFIAFILSFNNVYSQTYFYYTFNDETISLDHISDRYMIEYPNGLYNINEYPGEKTLTGYYLIDETELSSIGTYGDGPITHKIYETNDGVELRETSEIVLSFKNETTQTEKNNIIQTHSLTHIRTTSSYELYRTTNNSLTTSQDIYETGLVTFCAPNFLTQAVLSYNPPTDPYYNKQYYLKNTGQVINDGNSGTAGADINVEPAWDITTGDSDIIVAVIDVGFSDHPDLPLSRQVRPKGCNVSDYNGTLNPDDPIFTDYIDGYHGNACMGIIAASHNNGGIAGIAPNCKIMTLRVDIGGFIPKTDFSDGIDLAVDSGASIISNSWGYTSTNSNLHPVINNSIQRAIDKGVSIVFAAGNTANHAVGQGGYVHYPANATNVHNGLISVAATDRYDKQVNYSPTSKYIDITAVSTKAINRRIAGEAHDIWTLDIIAFWGANSWRDTVSSGNSTTNTYLPPFGEVLPNYGPDSLVYTGRFAGTSASAPQVAGVIALMKSVNPCLKPKAIKDILITTANKVGGYLYDWKGHSQLTGYGKVDAGKAVAAAQAMHEQNLDLYLKDHPSDYGATSTVGSGSDNSPDIWVRRQQDGFINQVHQNPLYHVNGKVYVYVRVRNKSCTDHDSVNHKGEVALFWNRSATVNSWGTPWTQIAVKKLSNIAAGDETILEFEWNTPTPNTPFASGWDACLVARIQNITSDPYFNVIPYNNLALFVGQNNNVTLKNLSIINYIQGQTFPGNINGMFHANGRFVDIGNPTTISADYDFTFEVPDILTSINDITEKAEVKIIFDDDSWEIFNNAGAFATSGVTILGDNMIAITDPEVTFSNITIPANTTASIYISASFWADPTELMEFQYRLVQKESASGDITGVQNYLFTKENRDDGFTAVATPGQTTINNGQSVTLTATSIGESALYNWYSPDGVIVHSGQSFNVTPGQSTLYTLQVVADADGCMDYCDVDVIVKQQYISSLSPNPANDVLDVDYEANSATNASLEIIPISGGTPTIYSINPELSTTTINVSNYANGNYYISLKCDGQIVDTKSLLIQ